MRRFSILSAGLCLLPLAAMAQGASGSAGPMVITITKTDCSRVIQHSPAPDVAYKPGVDVRGRPVASADTDPARAEFARKVLPEVLEIPITINPLTYSKAKTANKNKAAAASAVSANAAAMTANQAQGTALASQLSGLNSQLASVTAEYNAKTSANVAATGGGTPTAAQLAVRSNLQGQIDAAYTPRISQLNGQIASTGTAITANSNTQATLQGQDTSLRRTYEDTNMATEGTLAGLSGKGLDSTQMKVGVVKYDVARNAFTFNGEPMISEDQRALAEACARRGVR